MVLIQINVFAGMILTKLKMKRRVKKGNWIKKEEIFRSGNEAQERAGELRNANFENVLILLKIEEIYCVQYLINNQT